MEIGSSNGGNMVMDNAVKNVIHAMSERLSEPLTVESLADFARFSRFHFSRLFQRDTGMSPARFLAALRMAEARRLLSTTSMKVADISFSVGYTSVGTFTSRFTACAGVSPTRYRQLSAPDPAAGPERSDGCATLVAVVRAAQTPAVSAAYVGLFPAGAPSAPIRSAVVRPPGPCRFTSVPPGRWHLVCAYADGPAALAPDPTEVIRRARYVAVQGSITVEPHTAFAIADVDAGQLRPADGRMIGTLLDLADRRLAA